MSVSMYGYKERKREAMRNVTKKELVDLLRENESVFLAVVLGEPERERLEKLTVDIRSVPTDSIRTVDRVNSVSVRFSDGSKLLLDQKRETFSVYGKAERLVRVRTETEDGSFVKNLFYWIV